MLIMDYHCPYHSMYFEVIQEIKDCYEEKRIINDLYPLKKLKINYLIKVNLKILKKVCKNFYVNN